jgi:hypothetical protein
MPEAPQKSRKKLVSAIAGAALVLAAVAVLAVQGEKDSTDAEKVTATTSEESKSTSTAPGSTVAPGNTSPSVGAAGSPQAIAQAVGPAVVQIDDKGSIGSGHLQQERPHFDRASRCGKFVNGHCGFCRRNKS